MARLKSFLCISFLAAAFGTSVQSKCLNDTLESKADRGYVDRRIQIMWGITNKIKQIWDGYAEIDSGQILGVSPFIRHGMLDDSKLVGKYSWKSSTYTDVEGVFLFVRAPLDAEIKMVTKSQTFSFSLDEIYSREIVRRMDGNIEIQDVTDQVIYRIMGLEYGEYGSGSAAVSPRTAFVDSFGTWTITYTVEDTVPVGGGIRIAWHFTRTWGEPQFSDPAAPNFVSVRTDGRARLDCQSPHRGLFEYPFTMGRILVRVLGKPLHPGERIFVVLGDTSGESPGFQAGRVSEEEFAFRIESCTEVPDGAFPIYRRIEEFPSLEVKTRLKPEKLFAVAPSIISVNRPFTLSLVVEDKYRNTIEAYAGGVKVYAKAETQKSYLGSYVFEEKDKGRLEIENLTIDSAGIWRIALESENDVCGESNPILCRSGDERERLFWGELHGHTKYSDGYRTAENYFRFAREKAALDFAAITDHDVELDAPDYSVDQMWREINAAVLKMHDPPDFSTILGWEWSPNRITATTEYPYGDHNVYFFQEAGHLFPSGDDRSNSLEELYSGLRLLKAEGTKTLIIPHIGGAIANLEFHDPDLEPLLEIYSVHGSFEEFGQIALDRGYRIGFVAGSDAHNGQIGGFPQGGSVNHFVHGGLTGVYAKDLSRESLYAALTNRRSYATTGKRILVDFKVNDHAMGEEIWVEGQPRIYVYAVGEKPLWKVDVVKNGEVIHTKFNSFAGDNVVTILWRNYIERDELLNFDEGFWARRLRTVHWQGSLSSHDGGLDFLTSNSFDFQKDKIHTVETDSIAWESVTRGDYDGLSFGVEDPTSEVLLSVRTQESGTTAGSQGFVRISTEDESTLHFSIVPSEIPPRGSMFQIGSSDNIVVLRGEPKCRQLEFEFSDKTLMYLENYYYVRVTQIDGEMAWSSPIWVKRLLSETGQE